MRVLHVASALDAAGVPSVLMAYSRNASTEALEADFIVHGDEVGVHEAEVLERGSRVHHVTPRKKSLLRNLQQLWGVISSGDYDAVHSHLNFSSVFPLAIAWLNGTPIRIAHAHGSFAPRSPIGRAWHALARFAIARLATDYFSCSEVSGRWLFGSRWKSRVGSSYLMRNAIDVDELVSSAMEMPDDFWAPRGSGMRLIAVGRLSPEKNHLFLVDLARALKEDGKPFELVIVGGGPMHHRLQEAVERSDLTGEVRLLGARTDVAAWLGAADVCLMPSVREGLGVALIEAQVLGVPCVASPGVPKEVDLTGTVSFVPLEVGAWVDAVDAGHRAERGTGEGVVASGYDIQTAAPAYVQHMRGLYARASRGR